MNSLAATVITLKEKIGTREVALLTFFSPIYKTDTLK